MLHFLYRLNPPRAGFPLDMTDAEQAVMERHVGYWTNLVAGRTAICFGPVFDPAGVWGFAIINAESEASAKSIAENDPAISAGIGFSFDIHQTQLHLAPAISEH